MTFLSVIAHGNGGFSTGATNTCYIKEGTVRCVGSNFYGESNTVSGFVNPKKIVSGYFYNCVIDDEGPWCWGSNNRGQTDAPQNFKPVDVSVAFDHTCGTDGVTVQCWGNKEFEKSTPPVDLVNPRAVAVGAFHSCALDDRGVRCWGGNNFGQQEVPNLGDVRQLSSGSYHLCAITKTGTECWGRNNAGQTTVPTSAKVASQVTCGDAHTCALTSRGVICWGENSHGQTDVPADLGILTKS